MSDARDEIEDLWWLRHSLEALVVGADPSKTLRAGLLQSLLETTRPRTDTTDPRRTDAATTNGAHDA